MNGEGFGTMNMVLKRMRDEKGMTLIELLAVVVILGILAAVAGSVIIGSMNSARENADATTEAVLIEAVDRYLFDNPTKLSAANTAAGATISVQDDLVEGGYLKKVPSRQAGSGTDYLSVIVSQQTDGSFLYSFDPTP